MRLLWIMVVVFVCKKNQGAQGVFLKIIVLLKRKLNSIFSC